MIMEEISFGEILIFWTMLWPNRNSISPVSIIDFGGTTNKELVKYKPKFLACYIDKKIVGVNSIVMTSERVYRNRGIWVRPDKRKKNIGSFILNESLKFINERPINLWSMPRKDSLIFYLKNGFEIKSKMFHKYEFGPHCFVSKYIEEKR